MTLSLGTEWIAMLNGVLSALQMNVYWLSWNLYLAFIPLGLSLLLFRSQQNSQRGGKLRRSWLWWFQLFAFLAFLPNAPYLLTDVIHLIELSKIANSVWIVLLILIPVYLLFILAGFEAYVLSLINLGYYMNLIGRGRWIWIAELFVHSLCAVGVYLGRFLRFNSWDFIRKPQTLAISVSKLFVSFPEVAILAIFFVLLLSLYWIMKSVTLRILVQRSSCVALNKE